ncbi:MAG: Type 1 glutamine amidotransferase-like domain-containing protein [Deltaproteobacteria bacterium]|nr:Type 1 glutamine amidotransferase-like domain-containing protein [Deltaproteobacteria bacterium]
MTQKIALLGPQGATPDVGAVMMDLGITGPVALVRAGYQERESDDEALVTALRVPAVNLTLHARGNDVFKNAAEFATAYQARQQRLRHMQGFYRTRLEGTEESAKKISLRYVEPELLAQEEKVSVDQYRYLDHDHIERCRAIRASFDNASPPGGVDLIAKHRDEVRALMATTEALVIAGGHVASLLNRLQLFDVLGQCGEKPIIAWSAGAMVLTDRIVLFHDYPPYGSDIAQVLDAGFGLVPSYVVLPDARRRINFEARSGIQRFARRMAPATCVAMDHGARMIFEGGDLVFADATRLTTTGDAERHWNGEASRFSSPDLYGVHV